MSVFLIFSTKSTLLRPESKKRKPKLSHTKSYRYLYERWKNKSRKGSNLFSHAKNSSVAQNNYEMYTQNSDMTKFRKKMLNSRCSKQSNISQSRTSQMSFTTSKSAVSKGYKSWSPKIANKKAQAKSKTRIQ